jgi:hypothetical protein
MIGGDVGRFNISAHIHGLIGRKTSSIDRIARKGAPRSASKYIP